MQTLTPQQAEQVHGAGTIVAAVTRLYLDGLAAGDFVSPHPITVDY